MKQTLDRWLLHGEPLPEGFDLDKAMDQHPEYADLVADLEWIDTHVATLPVLHAPDTDPQWLQNIIETPQIPRLPDALEPAPPKTRRVANQGLWISTLVAIAAVLLFMLLPQRDIDQAMGDPSQWTERGIDPGLGPEVHLKIAVQKPTGTPSRFTRGAAYDAGDTLFFNVDSPVQGTVKLLRVDPKGVTVLHAQDISAGSENLKTPQGSIGYELESGEPTAVFAIVRFTNEPSTETLQKAIPAVADIDAVCAAVRTLGGRCAAERVEAVP